MYVSENCDNSYMYVISLIDQFRLYNKVRNVCSSFFQFWWQEAKRAIIVHPTNGKHADNDDQPEQAFWKYC